MVRFEAFPTAFFESEEEKFKFQRVASTHSIAEISMDVAHPCVARKESSRDSTPLVELVLRLYNGTKKCVSNRLGRKKQKHRKTWDEIANIQKNVRPSVSAGPCSLLIDNIEKLKNTT